MTEWYARLASDARFRRSVENAYEGRHAVADALWWLDHPDDDAPSGAVSPRRGLAELQRAAFSRPGSAAGGAGGDAGASSQGGADIARFTAQRELEALLSSIADDRAAALTAVERASGAVDAAAHSGPSRNPLFLRSLGALGGRAGGGPSAGDGTRVRLTRAGVLAAAGVLAVVVAGAVVVGSGAFVPGASEGTDASGGSATSGDPGGGSSYSATEGASAPDPGQTAPPFPNFPPRIGEDSYALVFSRPQLVSDLPLGPLPPDLMVVTFRLLSVGQYTRGSAYAAISTTDQVCLVVYGNATDYGLTCADIDVMAARGLQVSLITTDSKDPVTGTLVEALGVSARWEGDGTFALDASTPYDRD